MISVYHRTLVRSSRLLSVQITNCLDDWPVSGTWHVYAGPGFSQSI